MEITLSSDLVHLAVADHKKSTETQDYYITGDQKVLKSIYVHT